MDKRKIIYTNLDRNQLKSKLIYNFLKYSPLLFYYCVLRMILRVDILNIILLSTSVAIMLFRFRVFRYWHDLMNLLELEISTKGIKLITTDEDFYIELDEIIAVALLANSKKSSQIDIFLKVDEPETMIWPIGLKESEYLRIPMVFEDHSIDILDEWEVLRDKCKNYKRVKSTLN